MERTKNSITPDLDEKVIANDSLNTALVESFPHAESKTGHASQPNPIDHILQKIPRPKNESFEDTINEKMDVIDVESVDESQALRQEALQAAIEDIKNCDFVALDLEFTGLFRQGFKQPETLEKFFQESSQAAHDFLTVQIGLCPVWRDDSSDNSLEWIAAPYNFHVLPSCRSVFSSDSQTLQWLLHQGFSFDKWLSSSYDYARLAHLSNLPNTSKGQRLFCLKTEGLQNAIDHIIMHQKPMVVHNGFFDLLHVHDKFVAAIPSSLGEFCADWLHLFEGGVYDTKVIATAGRYKVFQIADDNGTSLSKLHNHFINAKMHKTQLKTVTRYPKNKNIKSEPLTSEYVIQNVTNDFTTSKYHEAGYDALITAQVFLIEKELYHVFEDGSQSGIPCDWASSSVIKDFKNVLEVRVSPGKIMMSNEAEAFKKQQESAEVTEEETDVKGTRKRKASALLSDGKDSETKSAPEDSSNSLRFSASDKAPVLDFTNNGFGSAKIRTRRVFPNLKLDNSAAPTSSWATPLRNVFSCREDQVPTSTSKEA